MSINHCYILTLELTFLHHHSSVTICPSFNQQWPSTNRRNQHIDIFFSGQSGLDYGHGTGHGVAAFGGVHQSPPGINSRSDSHLCEDMVLSNEPGYYKEGCYGIRIENLMLTKKCFSDFLCFELLSFAPFDLKLIDKSLLNADEINWINDYHTNVYDKLIGFMETDLEKNWLKNFTTKI